ncbi:dolichyl-phosphate-mannose--protein mannosyltransferase [Janibacter sp. G56]|uniref:dolichyl-phosphate-mannose--protein mannosyltransferase n=1 Tax=Janibacter sp. G56 TaxID=3418717 RepID=UPI003D023144
MTRGEQLRTRLLGFRPSDTLWGWFGPLLIAALGGVIRFWRLDRPHQLVFDETYYVKQGVSMLDHGVELRWQGDGEKVDPWFTHGTTDVFISTDGDMVVHPPVGKWVIAAGEWLFGADSSWGWRFSVAVLGTLSILMIGRIARRLFRSTLLGCVAAFLLAFEGHHFVHSRTGLLDLILMFFLLAGFGALLIDRDWSRAKLARKVAALPAGTTLDWGPWLGARPWRWVAGLSLGLAMGTKWSGLYALAVFGLMTVLWDMGARRAVGVRHWIAAGVVKDGPLAFIAMVGTAFVTYIASYVGWFRSEHGYDRHWAESRAAEGGFGWVPDPLRSLWHYHAEMYDFHVHLTSKHTYQANPWSWIVQGRPTSFFYEGPTKGDAGCAVDQCSKAIHSIGTVPVWWLGALSILVLGVHWALRRDWRAGAILAGLAATYLPWFTIQHRTIYGFYSVAFEPWVVLGATFVLGLVLGRREDSLLRRRAGLASVLAFLLLSLAIFAFFWPIYTAQVIPYDHWRWRMWFPSWI